MTTIETFISEREKEFEKKFCLPERADGTPPTLRLSANPSQILAFHRETISLLLGILKEEVEKKRKASGYAGFYTTGEPIDPKAVEKIAHGAEELGFNSALSAVEALLTIEK